MIKVKPNTKVYISNKTNKRTRIIWYVNMSKSTAERFSCAKILLGKSESKNKWYQITGKRGNVCGYLFRSAGCWLCRGLGAGGRGTEATVLL